MNQKLILASQSPRRRELLTQLGLPFGVIAADIDETSHPNEAPEAYARRLSIEKAQAIVYRLDVPSLILAADTIVVDGADVLGKPRHADEAASMLRRLRGHPHIVITAVTVLDTSTGKRVTEAPASPVHMRDYTDAEIAAYIATGDPMDKAGAYAIQHEGFHPVERFESCFANVMGLPICRVARLLEHFGVPPSAQAIDACRNHMGYPCTFYDQSSA